jgi:A/G-specific adenine glycosylase
MQNAGISKFNREVWDFYRKNKREFPWRETRDPYKILVSETMLQQTQTSRVVKFYGDFLRKFPGFKSLARASTRDVLLAWQGLGYNRRAQYLKKTAEIIVEKYGGKLPNDQDVLATLPGIGKNTAGAVCAYAFDAPAPFIETNIRKAFIHFFFTPSTVAGLRSAKRKIKDPEITDLIERALDRKNPREWYFAVVDYGSHLGKTTRGMNARSAHYTKQKPFEGSTRQWRSRILQRVLRRGKTDQMDLVRNFNMPEDLAGKVLDVLSREGILKKMKKNFLIVK